MNDKTLVKAGMKQHKGSLSGIFILILLISLALAAVLTIWINSGRYLQSEIRRAGFGDLTAWVSGVPDLETFTDDIRNLEDVERVETQEVVYSDYVVNGQESDSEGQLIPAVLNENRYKIFNHDLSGYEKDTLDIDSGEIYVSPSMVSMFDVQIGDEISFPIARDGGNVVFTVKGYYEDPFMGSSMIGMKGFLICQADQEKILQMIENAGINGLARNGKMLHIYKEKSSSVTIKELNCIMNDRTELSKYTEFVHSEGTIYGFMLILQNTFSGLLAAFVVVLLCAAMVVAGHSLSSTIETDFRNMGILKTVGYTSRRLRKVQLMQYFISIFFGMLLGLISAIPISSFVCRRMLTTTGILYPAKLPLGWCLIAFAVILTLFTGFIIAKTAEIDKITPLQAIQGHRKQVLFSLKKLPDIHGKGLGFSIAVRQLITGRRRYMGACVTAILLVFFASLVGRMDAWLGPDGKGLMDAFNPADLDIGVQIFGNESIEEMEEDIRSFTDITDSYLLAMPNVAVSGMDYTANVISDPGRFHILKGKTCTADDQVVLTEFIAEDLGVSIGDTLTIRGAAGSEEYRVSGIYQCANDMGDNIGMSREGYQKIGQDNPQLWCHHMFLSDPSQKGVITETLEDTYGGDVHVHENSWPGLFGIISAMRALVIFMYGMVILFILIITVLAGSKILSAEQKDLGIYKAIGFSTGQLRMTFALRFCLTAVIGSAFGTIFAAMFTDPLVSAVMKLAGISNFASDPGIGTVLFPAVTVTVLFTGFAYLAAGKMKKVTLIRLIHD